MTLGEVRALTKDWSTAPPLVFLVEALVKGFGGEPEVRPSPAPDRSIVSDLEAKNDRALQDIAYQAPPNQLPILHGRADPGLPKTPPVFDENVMRARNAERSKRAQMWMTVAKMRKER